MKQLCTVHMGAGDGPVAKGSQVRLPDGTPIPGVVSVKCEAVSGSREWVTTITLRCLFGEQPASSNSMPEEDA